MNRRDAVLVLLALGTAPLTAFPQQPAKPARIAWLSLGRPEEGGQGVDAFKRGMRELNYLEGKHFVFDFGWARGKAERLPDLAKELVARQPDIILTGVTVAVLSAQRATTTIPIVMVTPGNPVESGLVKSLARPGGNITGLTNISVELSPKLLELLLAAVPKLSRIAVLSNPSAHTPAAMLQNIQAAARKIKMGIVQIEAQTPTEIESAFEKMTRARAEAAIVLGDVFFYLQRRQIAELTLKHRMPAIFMLREHVESGGLMSYGVDIADLYRRAATYVDKILKGAKPADLPIEQPMTFDLVINLRTAKALGLTSPQSLLLRADTLIE